MATATLGIISIGDMGLGIAKLLLANKYRVVTNASDRSRATQDRAKQNGIELVDTDLEMCNVADFLLSIVPPSSAIATAQRIADASVSSRFQPRAHPLYFLDLNAISPRAARDIDIILARGSSDLRYIDGGIIGGPPTLQKDGSFYRPGIPLSGPHRLDGAQCSGKHLAEVLNVQHVNDTIGSATGLKMCFASLSKGFTALAIQSFTTAQQLGVLEELKTYLDKTVPGIRQRSEKGLIGMPPKAYRWVNEMEHIAETFEADGGFTESESPFRGIARIYDFVANGTDLGKEVTEDRQRGTTADNVADLMCESMERRKLKKD